MGIIEEIKTMQREGRSESDISQLMQSHGYAPEEVQEALAQSRIREAVAGGTPEMPASDSPHGPPQSFSHISGMEPSMLSPAQSAQQSPQTGQYQVPEQIVNEKIHSVRRDIDKVIELKNTVENKISYLDERLKRIEKIIDHLQLAILQKVGDYASAVEDVKNELHETQKSFKSLMPEARKSPQQQESQ